MKSTIRTDSIDASRSISLAVPAILHTFLSSPCPILLCLSNIHVPKDAAPKIPFQLSHNSQKSLCIISLSNTPSSMIMNILAVSLEPYGHGPSEYSSPSDLPTLFIDIKNISASCVLCYLPLKYLITIIWTKYYVVFTFIYLRDSFLNWLLIVPSCL